MGITQEIYPMFRCGEKINEKELFQLLFDVQKMEGKKMIKKIYI